MPRHHACTLTTLTTRCCKRSRHHCWRTVAAAPFTLSCAHSNRAVLPCACCARCRTPGTTTNVSRRRRLRRSATSRSALVTAPKDTSPSKYDGVRIVFFFFFEFRNGHGVWARHSAFPTNNHGVAGGRVFCCGVALPCGHVRLRGQRPNGARRYWHQKPDLTLLLFPDGAPARVGPGAAQAPTATGRAQW